ncbi:glycosyltransferase [Alkalihalobacillus pseudalcaliphilus]|uniref:glycosyltransferase n=1 Tax=Alkalihalobacillus pseudalcaliphilus TaxID=79884 RepID=UPI00064DFE64|nr:glycosyltransferase [Alkalihalobacillus pseudalcaliphilus]KMK75029.1 hypothetical protein AB990_16295 [Alkalihalobacillus pseudalcaliphilus]
MGRKKICIITTTSITIRCFLIEQLTFLTSHGYDVTVVCDRDVSLNKDLPANIRYYPITMKRGMASFGVIHSIYALSLFFHKERFDMVQYSTPNAALYASVASWLNSVPVRLYCQWGIRYVGFKGIRRGLFKGIEKLVCILSTVVEPDSYGNLQFSHQEKLYSANKSRTIWNGSANGVDFTRFNFLKKKLWNKEIRAKYKIKDSDIVFGFFGRLHRDKGITELLTAFNQLSEKNSHIKLLIVGPKEQTNLDSELMKKSIANEAIIFCDYTDEIEKYYAALDVFVLPSYREGFGTVVIEAGAMGVPVIVTNIPGPTDAMKEGVTGIIVEKGNIQDLEHGMKRMLNPSLREQMSLAAIPFVQQHFEQQTFLQHILSDRNRLIAESRLGKEVEYG